MEQGVTSGPESGPLVDLGRGKPPAPQPLPSVAALPHCRISPMTKIAVDIDERRRAARRGPVPSPADELRTHHVSTRLSPAELAKLDDLRARVQMQRGEFLRAAALHQLPPTLPALNVQAWQALARASANLNQLSRRVNAGAVVPLADVAHAVEDFRAALIGASEK